LAAETAAIQQGGAVVLRKRFFLYQQRRPRAGAFREGFLLRYSFSAGHWTRRRQAAAFPAASVTSFNIQTALAGFCRGILPG